MKGNIINNISMWADNIKRIPEWIFSAPFHYANVPVYFFNNYTNRIMTIVIL
jgi:hypothetical protein